MTMRAALVALTLIMIALVAQATAQAHESTNVVTLHNSNDSGGTVNGHRTAIACDGTPNGHSFGVDVKGANGRVAYVADSGSGSLCQTLNPGNMGEIVRVRWHCHGDVGDWRRV